MPALVCYLLLLHREIGKTSWEEKSGRKNGVQFLPFLLVTAEWVVVQESLRECFVARDAGHEERDGFLVGLRGRSRGLLGRSGFGSGFGSGRCGFGPGSGG